MKILDSKYLTIAISFVALILSAVSLYHSYTSSVLSKKQAQFEKANELMLLTFEARHLNYKLFDLLIDAKELSKSKREIVMISNKIEENSNDMKNIATMMGGLTGIYMQDSSEIELKLGVIKLQYQQLKLDIDFIEKYIQDRR